MTTRFTTGTFNEVVEYNYFHNPRAITPAGATSTYPLGWVWTYTSGHGWPGTAASEDVPATGGDTGRTREIIYGATDGPTSDGEYIDSYYRQTITEAVSANGALTGIAVERRNVPGWNHVGSVRIAARISVRFPAGLTAGMRMLAYRADGTPIVASMSNNYTTAAGWRGYFLTQTFTGVASNPIVGFRFEFLLRSDLPANSQYDATGVAVTLNTDEAMFWDGDSPDSNTTRYAWQGIPANSTAVRTTRNFNAADALTTENLEDWSVSEAVTARDPGQYSGGSPQFSVTVPYTPVVRRMIGTYADLADDVVGTVFGNVRDVSLTGKQNAKITCDAVLALLNSYQTVAPFRGTFSAAMAYYFGRAGVPAPNIPSAWLNRQVVYPGFQGNLYDHVKQILSAEGLELSFDLDSPVVREPAQIEYKIENFTGDPTVTFNAQSTSEKARIHYYGNTYRSNSEIFPVPPDVDDEEPDDPSVYSVDAGETLETEIRVKASLASVNQPTYVSFVEDRTYTGNGVYTAVGNDGLPVTPTQWQREGGSLRVQLTDDPSVIKVIIKGPNNAALAPYRIAMSSGGGTYYNALHITGTGVFITDRYVDINTGGDPSLTGEEFGVEVTNPYISTESQAYRVGQFTAGGQVMESSIQANVVALDNVGNQAPLGRIAGGRFRYDNAYYRIDTAEVTPTNISLNGHVETLVSDFNKEKPGMTMAQFNALWAGSDLLDFSLEPLRKE